uniref:Ras GEF n=1 Tax=Strongyloides stercoralis TaxID=6248 RepID=A0A0K0E053_STRER
MDTSKRNRRLMETKSFSRGSRSLSKYRSQRKNLSKSGRQSTTSTGKKSKGLKRHFKLSRSESRSTSKSGFTSRTMDELSTSSYCSNNFGLKNIMNKIFKEKIFLSSDQCYTFDGINGIYVSYKFIVASEGSSFFQNSIDEGKAPLAVYESAITPHVIREEHSKNASYGNSKIILQIFEDHVIYKQNIQIPYISSSNGDSKEILSNKNCIEHMFKKFSNNLYRLDGEILEWPEEISTYVVKSDLKRNGNEVHFKNFMEIWFGINCFDQEEDDYNVARFAYKEKETFYRTLIEMKTGESCSKISQKLVFPTSVIGDTFEIAYTKEFFMTYIDGKWIREYDGKNSNKNNLYLSSNMSNITNNDSFNINETFNDTKEAPRYRYKSSNISFNKNSIKDADIFNTTNISIPKISLNNTLIPLSHSTPRVINTQSNKEKDISKLENNKFQTIHNDVIKNFSKNFNSSIKTGKDNENSTQNIYYSMVSNNTTHNVGDETLNKQVNNEKNLTIKETIDKILGDVVKHTSNLMNIVSNRDEKTDDTSVYYSSNEDYSKLKLDIPNLSHKNEMKSPIVFESKPKKDSPLKELFDKLDTTQNSTVSSLSFKLEEDFNKSDNKNNMLSMPNNLNGSRNLSLSSGKSLSTIKEMSLEQGQTHSKPSKLTISLFSTKTNNVDSDGQSNLSNIYRQNSEILLPVVEKMEYINSSTSNTSLSNSLSKDLEEDHTQNESKELQKSQSISSINKYISNLNKNQDDSIFGFKNLQSPISMSLNTALSIQPESRNVSLNTTQNNSTSSELNNFVNLQPTTPINKTPEKCIIMKSAVRELPNIKRPKTPASLSKQILTPIRVNKDQTNENNDKNNTDTKTPTNTTTFSYLQTSRILQTPSTIKRTNSAFGLRGDDFHSSTIKSQNNENILTTPKKNLYRALSATPTKRCRSSSYNMPSTNNLNDQVNYESDRSFIDKSNYSRKRSVSPSKSSITNSSIRPSRNISIKRTPNSIVDKSVEAKDTPLNGKVKRSLKSRSHSDFSFNNNRRTNDDAKEMDAMTLDITNRIGGLTLEDKKNKTPPPDNSNMKHIELPGYYHVITDDGEYAKPRLNKEIEVEIIVEVNGTVKKLKQKYAFIGLFPSSDFKVLAVTVDGKRFQ